MPDKFMNRYRIPSARLSTWDYNGNGSYFITICTAKREHFFGKIIDSKMDLSPIGLFANKCWIEIPNHFPHFYLDEFVVMPDHIHGIVMIKKPYIDNHSLPHGVKTGHGVVVETGHALSLRPPKKGRQQTKEPHPRFRNQGRNTISAMVGSFKSAVTRYCNENKWRFGWQTRFHDHIIRDVKELYAIKKYIRNNPLNSKNDKFLSD
jgi:REP element-mobilizing transposase RayT